MSNGKSDGYNFASPATHVFSIKTKRPQISKSEDMLSQLPHLLTKGVTATREGLQFASPLMVTVEYFPYDISDLDEPVTISWNDAAKRLRYRDGEPWSHAAADNAGIIMGGYKPLYPDDGYLLHRLAAILCDTAEAFRVLHWCVTNLGGKSDE